MSNRFVQSFFLVLLASPFDFHLQGNYQASVIKQRLGGVKVLKRVDVICLFILYAFVFFSVEIGQPGKGGGWPERKIERQLGVLAIQLES